MRFEQSRAGTAFLSHRRCLRYVTGRAGTLSPPPSLLGAVSRRAPHAAASAAHSPTAVAPPRARARLRLRSSSKFLQAILKQGRIFKEIIEAMKDLVTDANLECGEDGLKLQAMDSSHVSLISLAMTKEGFDEFRCDRSLFLGLNLVRVYACVQLLLQVQ